MPLLMSEWHSWFFSSAGSFAVTTDDGYEYKSHTKGNRKNLEKLFGRSHSVEKTWAPLCRVIQAFLGDFFIACTILLCFCFFPLQQFTLKIIEAAFRDWKSFHMCSIFQRGHLSDTVIQERGNCRANTIELLKYNVFDGHIYHVQFHAVGNSPSRRHRPF